MNDEFPLDDGQEPPIHPARRWIALGIFALLVVLPLASLLI